MEGEGYRPQSEQETGERSRVLLERELSESELSPRAYNVLTRNGIRTIGQLNELGAEDLLNMRNFGRRQVEEVREFLAELGLSLKNED